MGVYLAAGRPLPLVPWDEARPSFNVTELSEAERPVRGRFSRPHVYYVGAYTGCSCGFEADEPGEEADARRSLDDLARYARDAADPDGIELFCCWDGDYLEPAAERVELSADELADADKWFGELVFATVRPPGSPGPESADP